MNRENVAGRETPATLEFTLSDKSPAGDELSPDNISLWQFNEFNNQVEQFLAGTRRKSELGHVGVHIEPGSYKLVTAISTFAATFIAADMALLEEKQDCLAQIDAKRAEVLSHWQAQSKKNAGRRYGIRLMSEFRRSIELNSQTDYKLIEPPWVTVEQYIVGTITDLGGSRQANIHVRLEDDPKSIITIAADREYLAKQTENLIYRKLLLHVKARQSVRGEEMRDYTLVGFVRSYNPVFDRAALEAAAEEGHRIWAEVEDVAEWVRAIRGGKE